MVNLCEHEAVGPFSTLTFAMYLVPDKQTGHSSEPLPHFLLSRGGGRGWGHITLSYVVLCT